MGKLISKLKFKNKKNVFIFIVFFLIILALILVKRKEIKFSQYAIIRVNNNVCEFKSQLDSDVFCVFEIINLSENPFLIIDIIGDDDIDFLNTRIKKLINKSDTAYVYTKVKPKRIGVSEKKVIVKSNAKKGDITLIIKGEVYD